jgi:DMSO/TMAO reductase YedYZ molybdopterin-dependent catalytic subunit
MLRNALLCLLCAPALAAQQPHDSLVVEIGGRRQVLRVADLQALPHRTLAASFGQGPQVYSGVPLLAVLARAGLDTAQIQGRGLAQTLLVEAADRYRVAFGVADLDSVATGRTLLLADSLNHRPLPPNEAPWRLVVAGDKHARRSVRMVTVVRVIAAPEALGGAAPRP